MRRAGELPRGIRSYNTCEYQGRLFHFTSDSGKLVVSELILDKRVKVKQVNTGVDCKCTRECITSCCPFNDKVLVMIGKQTATDLFCALITIDPGELTAQSIHIERKQVTGWRTCEETVFLAQISENEVWASFLGSHTIWIGEIRGKEIAMTKHPDRLPTMWGFRSPPLRLPDEMLLVVGELPTLANLTIIAPGDQFIFDKIGELPGGARYEVSIILIKERFVLGFGGWNGKHTDEMWIGDLQTGKASHVKKGGEWHPAGSWPSLAVKDNILYIIGGENITSAHSIPISILASLIQDSNIRSSFLVACLDFIKPSLAQRTDLQTIVDRFPLLQSELQARDKCIAELRWKIEILRRKQVSPEVLLIHLPSRTLPPTPFPQKWMIDAPGLEKFHSSMDVHQRTLPCSHPFLQEYGRVFQPFLEETLPRRLFLARGAVPRATVRVRCSSQVSRSLEPGQLLPKGPLPAELRPFPLRPEEKLLDSLEAEQVRWMVKEHDSISSHVREAAPPSYRFLASFIEKSDPLRRETRHASIGKLRSTVQASCALYRIERACGAEEALEVLEKAVRLGKDTARRREGE